MAVLGVDSAIFLSKWVPLQVFVFVCVFGVTNANKMPNTRHTLCGRCAHFRDAIISKVNGYSQIGMCAVCVWCLCRMIFLASQSKNREQHFTHNDDRSRQQLKNRRIFVTFVVAVVAESTRVTNGRHKLCNKCALRGCWEHARRIRRQIQNEISRLQLVFFLQSKKKKQFFYFVFGKSFRADWLTSNCWTEMSQWWTKWNLTVWVSMGGKARRYGTTYHSKIWDKQ